MTGIQGLPCLLVVCEAP